MVAHDVLCIYSLHNPHAQLVLIVTYELWGLNIIPAFQLGPLLFGKAPRGGRILPLFVRDLGPCFVLAGRESSGLLSLEQDKYHTKFHKT